MTANVKPRIGVYWASSCGGCDISLLEIGAHLIDLARDAEFVFWPCAADFKYATVAAYPDAWLDICLVNGGVRNSEQEEVARLLRRKSRVLVAYGACALAGGIPALANLENPRAIFDTVYYHNPSIDNPELVEPRPETETAAGSLDIPRFYPTVLRLSDVVDVDFELPGCPPQAGRVLEALQSLLAPRPEPHDGTPRVGCTNRSVCDECTRERRLTKIQKFRRYHQFRPEPGWCLLEQGVLCMGPATRGGCGALCLKGGMRCEGCYGPAGQSDDQGAAMIGALGSLLDVSTEEHARDLVSQVPDPLGTFYRFSMSASILKLARSGQGSQK